MVAISPELVKGHYCRLGLATRCPWIQQSYDRWVTSPRQAIAHQEGKPFVFDDLVTPVFSGPIQKHYIRIARDSTSTRYAELLVLPNWTQAR